MGYAGDITRMNIKAPSTIENKGPLSAAGGVVLDAPPEHESFDEKIARLKEQLKSVPTLPGVYLWKDASGQVIYVGKAKQLRARMKQYVMGQDERAKIPMMLEQVSTFEYVVVNNEHESLVLEKNLINQFSPFFNADFKDDKSYPFIAITKSDVFPAIKYTREKHIEGTRYFGPYTDSRAARQLVDIARKVVPICSSKCNEWRRLKRKLDAGSLEAFLSESGTRPCFDANVGLGPGVCCGRITPEEYRHNVERVERFLAGNRREFVDELTGEMSDAAFELDFERAGRIKARIDTINSLSDKQHAVSSRNLNADVVGISREETIAGVHVFMVREGRVVNGNEFVLDSAHGAKVRFTVPQRGEKRDLLDMACKNAQHTLMRYKVRTNYEDKRINDALLQLESALAMDVAPMRIECFDISTIHGSYTVASMVVFTGGRPDKNQYRRFKIKTPLDEANDFLSMQEVMRRRYSAERMSDERFGSKPDLIILDGGLPQLNAVLEMFDEMGIHDIALAGLAKRDEELFVPWQESGPVVLPSGSASLYLVKQVRDEAHRFAITFHRELRGKGMTKSILDDVVGLGPVRKKALLSAAGGFRKLRDMNVDEVIGLGAVPEEIAREVVTVLAQYNGERDRVEGLGEGIVPDQSAENVIDENISVPEWARGE